MIRQMTYQPPTGHRAPVEVMSFEHLRALNDGSTQRADFTVVAVIERGVGSVTVDFVTHPLDAGTAVWISPGAVHRWDDVVGLSGHLFLFVPTAPVTVGTRELVAAPDVAPTWPVPDEDRPFVDAAAAHLALEAAAPEAAPPEVLTILLSALVARLRPPRVHAPSPSPVFAAFRASVEEHFRAHHDVRHYARALGYSARTLTRAAEQATGRTAKAYIVDRIALEAERLLAHDRLSAAACAAALGFVDASNFSVFFRKATGMPPGAWQAAIVSPSGVWHSPSTS